MTSIASSFILCSYAKHFNYDELNVYDPADFAVSSLHFCLLVFTGEAKNSNMQAMDQQHMSPQFHQLQNMNDNMMMGGSNRGKLVIVSGPHSVIALRANR